MQHPPRKINIAIDGPAGAGKSTVARMVANELGYVYVDTGAMYRAVTLKAIRAGIHPDDRTRIAQLTEQLNIELIPSNDCQKVLIDGEDVTGQIRTNEVSQRVSAFSTIPEVREILSGKQRNIAAAKGVVMDGRDIGTKVIPDAEVKIFLTASVEERARRRYEELLAKGEQADLEQLKNDISERDRMDEQREHSPLVRADDAVLMDSTEMSISEVVRRILSLCETVRNDLRVSEKK